MSWSHPVLKQMQSGYPVIGATITVANVDVAAQAAAMGFDFIWIEMEHSPITLESLRDMVLATRGLKAMPLARVPVNEIWQAKRVLDAGVSGVIFPFTSTPDLARQAVAACKYPPAGRRGSGAGLARFRWPVGDDYYDFADRNFLVVAVVEEARAVESIDEIAATPGLDVIFIGTSDLSFSMGLRGKQDHPELQRAIDRVVDAAKRHGKFAGRPAFPRERIADYVSQGFLFFQADTDLGLMATGARAWLEP
ncbi:MAG: aldolase, partial [Candidatus Solibacter usitatus]|nr:aldolase [Candidatus Solibacter usitatus]